MIKKKWHKEVLIGIVNRDKKLLNILIMIIIFLLFQIFFATNAVFVSHNVSSCNGAFDVYFVLDLWVLFWINYFVVYKYAKV